MRGVVLQDSTRRPVAATVSAWRLDERPGTDRPLAITTTGARGEFELDPGLLPTTDEDLVLRVHLGTWDPDRDRGELAAVLQVPAVQREPTSYAVWITTPADGTRALFLRARDAAGDPLAAGAVTAYDLSHVKPLGDSARARGGWFTATCPKESSTLRFWSGTAEAMLVAEQTFGELDVENDLVFTPAGTWRVRGQVHRRADDAAVPNVRVELLDRAGVWPAPVAAHVTDAAGSFALAFGRALATPPEPSFAIWFGDERLAVVDWPGGWRDGLLDDVAVVLDVEPDQPLTYRVGGQVLARDSRSGVPDVQVEVRNLDPERILRIATTDASGRFSTSFRATAAGGPPSIEVRIMYAGSMLGAQPVPPRAWVDGATTVYVEVDSPARGPSSYRIAGRLLNNVTREGVGGLRIEAWDKTPRAGGIAGAAITSADDGTFDLVLPPGPSQGAPPVLFFRLYAADTLVPAPEPSISWDDAGLGTTVIEIAGKPDDGSGEVVLHELGETIATAVNRMQRELVRYPSELGAYIVDELDLSVPVAVQLDRLGQVRARVVDRAPADEQLGRFRMRVRPVMGVQAAPSEQLDQPLSALPELTSGAIAKLAAERVYSVEDLARRAQAPAGREALEALGLGVDLDRLLDKVALLAVRVLPRPIRDAVLRVGIGSLQAFAGAEPGALAGKLTADVGQTITADAVRAWQQRVADLLRIPLPAVEPEEEPS